MSTHDSVPNLLGRSAMTNVEPFTVVGIGASAGGLHALQAFFNNVVAGSGFAYVVIVHLDPSRDSHMAPLLQTGCVLPVTQVVHPVRVEADRVYIIPPGRDLSMADGMITLSDRVSGPHAPIDLFFRTLAQAHAQNCVGIVLSGTGSDGTIGLGRIKEAGGITIAQSPHDAEYDGMPRSAIEAGQVEVVLPVSEIPSELLRLRHSGARIFPDHEAPAPDEDPDVVGQILHWVRGKTGHDFSEYKRATILRRVQRRIRFNHLDRAEEYLNLVREDPTEARALFQDLLISVSSFFRDAETFAAVERTVIPEMFAGKESHDTVRVWIPGAATGEEAYSIAMLLREHADTLDKPPAIQIFATDIDEVACARARAGLFPDSIINDVSGARLQRFFDREPAGYRAKPSLRERILFTTHNLLVDPPFSRLDLVSCRNVLIYLKSDAQRIAIESFHYGLRTNATLILGMSESVSRPELFQAVDSRLKIYRSRPVARTIALLPRAPDVNASMMAPHVFPPAGPLASEFSYGELHLRMLESYSPPSLVVDRKYDIVHLSPHAGRFLHMSGGEPTRNVMDLIVGPLRVELRSALYQAIHQGEPSSRVVLNAIDGQSEHVELSVSPLDARERPGSYALVVFNVHAGIIAPAGSPPAPYSEAEAVAALDEELVRTRDQLESVVRTRDVTIEELQTSNEELRSINEEHRATSEELETSREELQSINEELSTINQEHRATIDELNQTNADLKNLMAATEIGTLFLDEHVRVRRFTPSIQAVFNLIPGDIGRPLAHITHTLHYAEFIGDVKRVFHHHERIDREVESDTGSWFNVRIVPFPSTDDHLQSGAVVTFYDITVKKHLEAAAHEARRRAESESARLTALMESMRAGVLIVDAPSGRVLTANERAREIWDGALPVAVSEPLGYIGFRSDGTRYAPEEWPMARAAVTGEVILDEEIETEFADGRRLKLLMSAAPVAGAGGTIDAAVVTVTDITERARAEEARLRIVMDSVNLGYWEFNLDTLSSFRRSDRFNDILGDDAARVDWNYARLVGRIHPADRNAVDDAFRTAREQGGIWDFEARLNTGDGPVRWVWVRASIHPGEDARVIGIIQDITERKRLEHDLRAAKIAAEDANQSKTAFLATLSHEFRTPLNGILGYTDLLLVDPRLDEQQTRKLDRIKIAVWHLAAMIEEILNYAKLDAGHETIAVETVDVCQLASEAAAMCEPRALARDLAFEMDIPAAPLLIQTDRAKARQILVNLLGNAVKYTLQGKVALQIEEQHDRIVFRVLDTGIGIEPEHWEHIFDRFWQVSDGLTRTGEGTGIGLSAARAFARLLGGDVTVESQLNVGSTFTAWLPRAVTAQRFGKL